MKGPPTVCIALRVNRRTVVVDVPPGTTLLELVRNELQLTGAKEGCGVGECGACTVLVDNVPVLSCLMLADEAADRAITTIECRGDQRIERLRNAFLKQGALQCGFCTPGMIMAACRLGPDAEPFAIREALAGNVCRCTGYASIVRAVQHATRAAKARVDDD